MAIEELYPIEVVLVRNSVVGVALAWKLRAMDSHLPEAMALSKLQEWNSVWIVVMAIITQEVASVAMGVMINMMIEEEQIKWA